MARNREGSGCPWEARRAGHGDLYVRWRFRDEYADFRAKLPLTAAPIGALVHAHAERGSGFITVEVWEDREALQGFLDDVLAPAVRAMGLPLILPDILDIDDFVVTEGVHSREIPYGTMLQHA